MFYFVGAFTLSSLKSLLHRLTNSPGIIVNDVGIYNNGGIRCCMAQNTTPSPRNVKADPKDHEGEETRTE